MFHTISSNYVQHAHTIIMQTFFKSFNMVGSRQLHWKHMHKKLTSINNDAPVYNLEKQIRSVERICSRTVTSHFKARYREMFRLSDYDCIGFDLDNTILRYKLTDMVNLEYEVLAKYLVDEKGYSAKHLMKPIGTDIDFLQKGLLLDFYNGNSLQVGIDGYVLKACHGTRFMSTEEIMDYYGPDRKWKVASEFSQDFIGTWNGPISEKMRTLLDYFDMPSSLAFARIIDSLDAANGKKFEKYDVWPDVLAGLIHMFSRDHFDSNKGGYFPGLKANPSRYINKCSETVLNWLRHLKRTKKTFLITGSNVDFASFSAKHCMGEDWRSLFDVIVCYARKPGFFTEKRPFLKLDGILESDPVLSKDMELGGSIYSQGNWQDLYRLLSTEENPKPKCLYFGDNLIQDIYTPSKYKVCDTVAIVEEMAAEGMVGEISEHTDTPLLVSEKWGSYFCSKDDKINCGRSLWDEILRNHSKICVPDLEAIAKHDLDHEYKCFQPSAVVDHCNPEGYYPSCPTAIGISK